MCSLECQNRGDVSNGITLTSVSSSVFKGFTHFRVLPRVEIFTGFYIFKKVRTVE
jgi:hypothetical protein